MRLGVRVEVTPPGLPAIAGLVSAILLSVATIVRADTSPLHAPDRQVDWLRE